MFKKFTEGLAFGGGFAISFVTLWYVAAYVITPMLAFSFKATNEQPAQFRSEVQGITESDIKKFQEPETPFHELTLEDQIKHASVIALAKYERAPDGQMKAIIKEFLKKEPGVKIYYDIGDEYRSSSYYPKDQTMYGEGSVIFFVGSPASMRMSMSYSGDRIHSLGDLPLELLRRKCQKPSE